MCYIQVLTVIEAAVKLEVGQVLSNVHCGTFASNAGKTGGSMKNLHQVPHTRHRTNPPGNTHLEKKDLPKNYPK